jgi:hypothetical protein
LLDGFARSAPPQLQGSAGEGFSIIGEYFGRNAFAPVQWEEIPADMEPAKPPKGVQQRPAPAAQASAAKQATEFPRLSDL